MKFTATLLFVMAFKIAAAQHTSDTAKPAAPATSILLEQLLNKKELQNNMVRIETVIFPPGYTSRKHTHPCPLFVYVVDGELLSEFDGVKNVYKAGDVFYEKPNGVHSITKNNSSSISVKFLVIYLMKEGTDTFLPVAH